MQLERNWGPLTRRENELGAVFIGRSRRRVAQRDEIEKVEDRGRVVEAPEEAEKHCTSHTSHTSHTSRTSSTAFSAEADQREMR